MMKLVGEFFGTLVFLWAVARYGTPLAVGVGLAVAAYAFGHLSGGHYNPAVTFMKYLSGTVSRNTLVSYTLTQMFAAYVLIMFLRK